MHNILIHVFVLILWSVLVGKFSGIENVPYAIIGYLGGVLLISNVLKKKRK